MAATDQNKVEPKKRTQPFWLIYLALLLSGILLLGEAASYAPLMKVTARLGTALLFSALALFVGNGRPAGFIATGIIWVAVLVTAAV